MKKSKRVLAMALALVMVLGLFAIPALAATSNSKSGGNRITFQMTTGKGLFYTLGWKKTRLTVRNDGKKNVTVYEKFGNSWIIKQQTLRPGQTWSYDVKGSGKNTAFMVQSQNYGSTKCTCWVTAGSVS